MREEGTGMKKSKSRRGVGVKDEWWEWERSKRKVKENHRWEKNRSEKKHSRCT